jgi:hypothetical protein
LSDVDGGGIVMVHGVVTEIVNKKKGTVSVKWNE